ncbi:MAG: hypothetical protein KJ710_03710 [Candidatus Omnitrophica bacterium]|nr:hypothetical protein [Candidatus Omnitrophota bacterium]MBU1923354.1 hypothetical protein [Candidatus Omnitrophota bacterium]
MNIRFSLVITCYLLSTVLSGCAIIKEAAKGFIGVSTQVLEKKRKDALKKSFAIDYDSCYAKVKDILKENNKESCIYAEDTKKKMISIYLSEIDTTPVGIFFTEEKKGFTMIEISSPSIYAKEYIANMIFTGIDALLKPKNEPEGRGLATE